MRLVCSAESLQILTLESIVPLSRTVGLVCDDIIFELFSGMPADIFTGAELTVLKKTQQSNIHSGRRICPGHRETRAGAAHYRTFLEVLEN